jgi:catechol 2,3-dioxygenase-like lactoylglutathione lyase family enzyme
MLAIPAYAQLFASKGVEIAMGHYHFNVSDVAAQKKFWLALGGATATLHKTEIVQFPNALLFFDKAKSIGGTRGSSVNHIGFEVQDIRASVDKLRGMGYEIATRKEVSGGQAKEDIFRHPTMNVDLAFVIGPDDIKVELTGNPSVVQTTAHHIHFFVPDVEKARSWYVEKFGFTKGKRGPFEEAQLAGIRLSFSKSEGAVAGTKGRSLDHIGFESRNVKKLGMVLEGRGVALDAPYKYTRGTKTAAVVVTDPDGTRIELTEGLKQVGDIGPAATR